MYLLLVWRSTAPQLRPDPYAPKIIVTTKALWLDERMTTFSERQDHKPKRSELYQYRYLDERLENNIWNFLREQFFDGGIARDGRDRSLGARYDLLRGFWTEVIGEIIDKFPTRPQTGSSSALTRHRWDQCLSAATKSVRHWYSSASWNEIYDALEWCVQKHGREHIAQGTNALLEREGSAYRFVGSILVPITNRHEMAELESVICLSGPFEGASKQLTQALELLQDRNNPDFRNAIKEAISAVESAVEVITGVNDLRKGLQKLGMHSQLTQAWSNMYNWTSDEDGIRHAMIDDPQIGLAEARYMVVTCSAFVNYLVARHGEDS